MSGLGYWRKVELGQKVTQERLPNPSEKCQSSASFWLEGIAYREAAKKAEEAPQTVQVKAFESKPKNRITVPEVIRKLHSLAKQTLEVLRNGAVDDYGRSSHSYGGKSYHCDVLKADSLQGCPAAAYLDTSIGKARQ